MKEKLINQLPCWLMNFAILKDMRCFLIICITFKIYKNNFRLVLHDVLQHWYILYSVLWSYICNSLINCIHFQRNESIDNIFTETLITYFYTVNKRIWAIFYAQIPLILFEQKNIEYHALGSLIHVSFVNGKWCSYGR